MLGKEMGVAVMYGMNDSKLLLVSTIVEVVCTDDVSY